MPRSAIHALALLVGALLVVVASLGDARADDVADEADHLFNLGTERYAAGDYKTALQHFLASNRLVRNRNVMFNIARSHELLRNYPDAYRYYQRAGEGETDASSKQRIREALARLASSVALLEVKTDPPGASLYLNRKDLGDRGAAPQTIALSPGKYTVIAELAGHQDAVSPPLELRVGTERSVSLKLVRIVGTVRVAGTFGAQVRVDTEDGAPVCELPCDAPVPPGQHSLVVTKAGYRQGRYGVQVRVGAVTNLKADLEPEMGSLVVSADEPAATIEVDGKTRGFTPSVLQLPAGRHAVRVTLGGFKPVVREVEVKTNEQTQLDLVLLAADAVEAASRIAESIEDAPASVTLVPTPELRGMRYPTVAEALRGVRGVYVSDDRQYKSVGFRGFSRPGDYGNRVLVLIDGQPVNDNWLWSSYVGYDLRTDLDDVARIEVVRGPGSVLYGTGAFSGVINLVTLGADAPDGREVAVSVADEGVARARARITHHFAKNVGVWASVSAGRSAGNDYFFPEWVKDSAPTVAGHARGVDDFRVATAQGRFFYGVASVQWFFNTHDKAIPIGDSGVLFGDARNRQQDTRAYVEAKVEPKLGDLLTSTTRVHANYYGFRSALPTDPGNGGLDRNAYDGSWVGAEQRIVLTPVDKVRLTGGGELQYHFLAHELTRSELQGVSFDQRNRFTLAAGYAMADLLPVRSIKISAAARVDAYSTSGASINPRLAVVVKPYEGGNVKLLVGKAFRAPSVYELTSSGGGLVANPELRSENLYSSEIEYSHRFSQNVVGALTAYANVITDLIALRDLPLVPGATEAPYRYENTRVPVGTLGGEAELRREWKGGWMLGASYSFQRSRYLASESLTSLFSGKTADGLREVPSSPNHGGSVRGAAPILGRALLLTSRLTAEAPRWDRNDVDGAPPQGRTQPALLWDVVLSGSETRWGLSYALGLYNAFDTRWTVPLSTEFRQTKIVQNGRTVLASAGLAF